MLTGREAWTRKLSPFLFLEFKLKLFAFRPAPPPPGLRFAQPCASSASKVLPVLRGPPESLARSARPERRDPLREDLTIWRSAGGSGDNRPPVTRRREKVRQILTFLSHRLPAKDLSFRTSLLQTACALENVKKAKFRTHLIRLRLCRILRYCLCQYWVHKVFNISIPQFINVKISQKFNTSIILN